MLAKGKKKVKFITHWGEGFSLSKYLKFIISSLNFSTNVMKYHHSHFADKKTEVQGV